MGGPAGGGRGARPPHLRGLGLGGLMPALNRRPGSFSGVIFLSSNDVSEIEGYPCLNKSLICHVPSAFLRWKALRLSSPGELFIIGNLHDVTAHLGAFRTAP